MADPVQLKTQINLPNPRTPLIEVKDGIGYPTREFMALLRQFTIRIGGTGGDVDIITPEGDIQAATDSEGSQEAVFANESMILVSQSQLQEMISEAVSIEVSMALSQRDQASHSPLAMEMTMGEGFEPV